jgi:FtsP/CotA-like multicopper oxidase with cupredoxin domain
MKYLLLLLVLIWTGTCFASPEIELKINEREITVLGKPAKVFAITQPDGTFGLTANKGENFNVKLINSLSVPTSIHWHGLILPDGQDGVAFVTQYAIYPGLEYHYQFPLVQSGTYFMHSHFGLQEQRLLSAPLILLDENDPPLADKEVVILLADFSFKSPSEIYQELRCPKTTMNMKMTRPDVVEVNYDAFLANSKTLDNPEVFAVKPGSRVRLRCINAASATNFFISVGALEGTAIAVDGNRIEPLKGRQFELGVAQRIDIVVTIPSSGGTFPILAQGEATDMQTGVILSTNASSTEKLNPLATQKAGVVTNHQEALLRALYPLPPKPIDRKILLELGGNMSNYQWTINGQMWPEVTPVVIKKGERVEITFLNSTMMSHPMHLHGHVFQVTEVEGKPIKGAMRDTILVGPKATVKIQFDADNPGVWPLHCHLLYHMEAGMFTVVRYDGFQQPLTNSLTIQEAKHL